MKPTDQELDWAMGLPQFHFLNKSAIQMFFEHCDNIDHFIDTMREWTQKPHPDKCWKDFANETRETTASK